MASYLLPTFFQKRILRYALSRLELLNTDDLDLDKLDIAWGKQSKVELKDVGLRLAKLSSLIHLPSTFVLKSAKALSLKLTIPADIYRTSIIIEIEGIRGDVEVLDSNDTTSSGDGPRNNAGQELSNLLQSSESNRRVVGDTSASQDLDVQLPGPDELARSFWQDEPLEEKKELEAAVTGHSELVGDSTNSSLYDDQGEGLGGGYALPSFISGFLQGILDRLQIRANDVRVAVTAEVPVNLPSEDFAPRQPESMTIELALKSIELLTKDHAISNATSSTAIESPLAEPNPQKTDVKPSKRRVRLREISCHVISDPGLLNRLSKVSGQSSPRESKNMATRSGHSSKRSGAPPTSNASSSNTASTSTSDDQGMAQSVILNAVRPDDDSGMTKSLLTEDGDRFADALDDETLGGAKHEFRAQTLWGPAADVEGHQSPGVDDGQFDDGDVSDTVSSTDSLDPRFKNFRKSFSSGLHLEENRRVSKSDFLFAHGEPETSTTATAKTAQSVAFVGKTANDPPKSTFSSRTAKPSLFPTRLDERNQEVFSNTPASSSDQSTGALVGSAEDLSESKLFTHEEAQSMYMSALSHKTDSDSGLPRIPGAWNSSVFDERSVSSEDANSSSEQSISRSGTAPRPAITQEQSRSATPKPADSTANAVRARSDTSSSGNILESTSDFAPASKTSKELVFINQVDLEIADRSLSQADNDPPAQSVRTPYTLSQSNFKEGTMSITDSDLINARSQALKRSLHSKNSRSQFAEPSSTVAERTADLEIMVGNIKVQADLAIAHILFSFFKVLSDSVNTTSKSDLPTGEELAQQFTVSLLLNIENVSFEMFDSFYRELASPTSSADSSTPPSEASNRPQAPESLLGLSFGDLRLDLQQSQNSSNVDLELDRLVVRCGVENVISFQSDTPDRVGAIQGSPQRRKDFLVSMAVKNNTRRVFFSLSPIHIALDLQKLDETFSCLGGFSTILGMGSSIISTSTAKASDFKSQPRSKVRKELRFDSVAEPPIPSETAAAVLKIDFRIGGCSLDVIGKESLVRLYTSSVKIIHRRDIIAIQVQSVGVSGPHIRGVLRDPPIQIQISALNLVYLDTPEESDLTRLLALLTPSQNKYDDDDDILVDTLLRQRRQGAVLRINCDEFTSSVCVTDDLQHLSALGEELSRLSTVTKYLPDDDRPGFLSLVAVKDLRLRMNIDSRLDELFAPCTNLEVAFVSVPSLIAMRLETFNIQGISDEFDLVGEAVPEELGSKENGTPMLMARLIGDEMEPTIKIKLCNTRFEYRVRFLLTLLGLKDEDGAEQVLTEIADSVATLRKVASSDLFSPRSSDRSEKSIEDSDRRNKFPNLSIILRDCVIGLNPVSVPSKALVVFTDTKLSARRPKSRDPEGSLDIINASLLIIDDMNNMLSIDEIPTSANVGSHPSRAIAMLCSSGFVSVGNMRSASVTLKVSSDAESGDKHLDVEFKDDLLILETCADSTQTLSEIMSSLSPPKPPTKDMKFQTEIIPVQDMLASLSGDAFAPEDKTDNIDDLGGEDFEDNTLGESVQTMNTMNNLFKEEAEGEVEDSVLIGDTSTHSEDLNDVIFPSHFAKTSSSYLSSDSVSNISDHRPDETVQDQYEPLDFRENHFGTGSVLAGKARRWDSVKNAYGQKNEYEVHGSPLRVRIRDVHIIWNMFDGYDWQKTRDTISKAVRDVEIKAVERQSKRRSRSSFEDDEEEEKVIGDFLFNSIYIGIPTNRDPRELTKLINNNVDDLASETESYAASTATHTTARPPQSPRPRTKSLKLARSRHHKMTFELKGVSADLVVFPPGSGETQSSIELRVRDFEIFDHVPSSAWKKFATYMHDAGERELGSSMIRIEIVNVKPVPDLAASEIVLRATILPLRLHVDQDALDFMTRFFEFKDENAPRLEKAADPPFLQRVEINSVRVKLDYKPKAVDYAALRSGHTTEFMNFFILDQANLVLRHVIVYGVSGFDKLSKTLNDVWMPDVRQNQLPGILAGLTPIRPLVNVGGGVRDLIAVPIREYRKDGRVVRSIQKGTISFARTTTSELVKLGAKIAIATQTALQGAEGLLAPTNAPSSSSTGDTWEIATLDVPPDGDVNDEDDGSGRAKVVSHYADQPLGVMQGLKGAYASLERDLLTARDAIVAVPGEIMESKNATGAAKAVLRYAPTIIFRPAIGASRAVGQTMLGAANALDPQERRRTEDKYKRH